jgi:hypothetical protein
MSLIVNKHWLDFCIQYVCVTSLCNSGLEGKRFKFRESKNRVREWKMEND